MCLKMDFKKLASEANTLFSRAKQFTEEKLGQVERTEYDAQLDNFLQKADKTKQWTEQIVGQTEAILQPNPSVRLEEFIYEKVQGKKPQERLVEDDVLGQNMIDAGNDFGSTTPYGRLLIQCGQTHQQLGLSKREFIQAAANDYLQPLTSFLEGDMKTIQKERRILETKRLDLDAAKSRLRRAKSLPAKESAENELRIAQSEFDRHAEVTRLLLEGLGSSHAHHARCLQDFVDAQAMYYAQCHQHMVDLQKQLNSVAPNNAPVVTADGYGEVKLSVATSVDSSTIVQQGQDFDASGMTELSLTYDEELQASKKLLTRIKSGLGPKL